MKAQLEGKGLILTTSEPVSGLNYVPLKFYVKDLTPTRLLGDELKVK